MKAATWDSRRVSRFDTRTGRWVDVAPLPHGLSHAGVAVLDGKLYAVGGFQADPPGADRARLRL